MVVSAAERASFREAVGASFAALVAEVARERDLGTREIEVGQTLERIFEDLSDGLRRGAQSSEPRGAIQRLSNGSTSASVSKSAS